MVSVRGKMKRCKFATSPEHKLCKRKAFRKSCPFTCDMCEVNEEDTEKDKVTCTDRKGMFIVQRRMKKCNFASFPEHKLCNRRAFQRACPVTCHICDAQIL